MRILCREPSVHLVSLELYVKDSLLEIILEVLKTECALILKLEYRRWPHRLPF